MVKIRFCDCEEYKYKIVEFYRDRDTGRSTNAGVIRTCQMCGDEEKKDFMDIKDKLYLLFEEN